jgi:hypothetical protein
VPFSSWDVVTGEVREVRTVGVDGQERTEYRRWRPTKRLRRLLAGDARECGAKTRQGTPCRMQALSGRQRCRLHGGASTGPRSEAGRVAIAASNRRRAKARVTATPGPASDGAS